MWNLRQDPRNQLAKDNVVTVNGCVIGFRKLNGSQCRGYALESVPTLVTCLAQQPPEASSSHFRTAMRQGDPGKLDFGPAEPTHESHSP